MNIRKNMENQTSNYISDLGFVSTEAFLNWQLTRYLLERAVYLQAKIHSFKLKYETDFESFESAIQNSENEAPEKWDDSILWEALEIDLAQVQNILAKMELSGIAVYNEAEVKVSIDGLLQNNCNFVNNSNL